MYKTVKSIRVCALILSILALSFGTALAQSSQPASMGKTSNNDQNTDRGVVEVAFGSQSVSIDYGRPQLKGRDMLAQAPDGFVWRFGSNASTTVETTADLMFGAKKLSKGKYSAWLKHVGGDRWALIFNSEVGGWGAGAGAAKRENDVLEVPFMYSKGSKSVERFTVDIMNHGGDNGHMLATWGTHRLETTFKFN